MHVPVQDMQVCCVQQMGTHMCVRAGAMYTHRHRDVWEVGTPPAQLPFPVQVLLQYEPTQVTEILVWPMFSGEVSESCFIFL